MLPDAYGCVVANRFLNLLDDEADPFDKAESEKEKKKEELKSIAAAKQKKPAQRGTRGRRVAPLVVVPVKTSQESLAGPKKPSRAEVVNKMTGNAAMDHKQEEHYLLPKEYSIQKPDFDRRGRGESRAGRGGGGRGGGAYTRNSENFNLRGKREFERHSGTGKSPEDKRGGRGPYNWGPVGDTAGELMEVTPDATAKPEDPQPKDPEPTDPQSVSPPILIYRSLDDWKNEQEMSRPKVELNLRKADSKVPSKATVIHQSKHVENKEEYFEEEEEEGYYVRRANDITSRLDINFGCLKRPTRGRGRDTREKPPSPTEQPETRPLMFQAEVAPNPDDPEDFPALTAGR